MVVMKVAMLLLLGVILGSFVNALVWRLHEQEALKGKKTKAAKKRLQDLSISKGRSMCPHCGHTLAAKDLVPVLSWLWLKGKCHYCQAPIGVQYPAVELLTGVLFAVSYLAWPYGLHGVGLFQLIVWLVLLVLFVALAVYDLRWFLLPDKLVVLVTILAVVQTVVVALWLKSLTAAWQPVLGGAIIFGLFWSLYQLSKGAWIGGGDVKLAAALGLLAGTPLKAFLVIFFASLIGTIASIPVLARGKKALGTHIPFGPCLLLALVIVVLYGEQIANWYRNLLIM